MRTRLGKICCIASTAICIALAALTIRSFRYTDTFYYHRGGGAFVVLGSSSGQLAFGVARASDARGHKWFDYIFGLQRDGVGTSPPRVRRDVWILSTQLTDGYWGPWHRFNFGVDTDSSGYGTWKTWHVSVPHLLIVVLAGVPTAVAFGRSGRRAARRRRRGLCVHCGYDLRACTERCPECGTPINTENDAAACGVANRDV